MNKTSTKQKIGFFLECTCFIFGGFLIGKAQGIWGFLIVTLGFILAAYTGMQIEKDAIKFYKEENNEYTQ